MWSLIYWFGLRVKCRMTVFSRRLCLDTGCAAFALSVGTTYKTPCAFLSGLPSTAHCLWSTSWLSLFSYLERLPKAALEIWELPLPSCRNVRFLRKQAIATWQIFWGHRLCCSVWGLLFLAGNTSAFWGLLLLAENTYFCFLRVTPPGQEYFCLRWAYSSWPGILLPFEGYSSWPGILLP